MTKKIVSILLAVLMLASVLTVAAVSVAAETPTVDPNEVKLEDGRQTVADACAEAGIGIKRYYFYMPEDWYNDLSQTAGIYWWDTTGAPKAWPGYYAYETAFKGIFYADVPEDATTIVWNNGVNGGTDESKDIFAKAKQTKNIGSEYYDPGESETYPDGIEDGFDGMVYVIDPNGEHETNPISSKLGYAGEWYYYYGDGTCGTTPEKGENFTVLSKKDSGKQEASKDEVKPSATKDQKPTTSVKPTDAQSKLGAANNGVVRTGDVVLAVSLMVFVVLGTVGAGYFITRKRKQ